MFSLFRHILICSLVLLPALAAAATKPTAFTDIITKGPLVDVRAFSSFSAAKASSATAGKTILIATPVTVNTATIPSDRAIKVEKGGSINVTSGKTLTINGPFSAGSYSVFTGSGVARFGPSTNTFYPEWWGAVGDGTTDDSGAWRKAIVSASALTNPSGSAQVAGRIVKAASAYYAFESQLDITVPIIIDFSNAYLYPNFAGKVFNINASNANYNAERVVLRDGTFLGRSGFTNATHLVYVQDGTTGVLLENINAWALTVTGAIIETYKQSNFHMKNCTIRGCAAPYAVYLGGDGTLTTWANTTLIDHVDISSHTGACLQTGVANFSITNQSSFEGCSAGGILIAASNPMSSIADSYFENNTGGDIIFSNHAYAATYAVRSCIFTGPNTSDTYHHIRLTDNVTLTVSDSYFEYGGVYAAAPSVEYPNYIGINNRQLNTTAGYNGTFDIEMVDGAKAFTRATFINKYGTNYINDSSNIKRAIVYSDTEWTGATGATPPTGWSVGVNGTFTITTGKIAPYTIATNPQLKIEHNGTDNNPVIVKTYTTVAGAHYRFSGYISGSTPTASIKLGTTSGGAEYTQMDSVSGSVVYYSHDFIASSTSTYVTLLVTTSTTGQWGAFDEIYLENINH